MEKLSAFRIVLVSLLLTCSVVANEATGPGKQLAGVSAQDSPFQAYKANYLLYNPGETEIKFQFSLEIPIFTWQPTKERRLVNPLTKLYAGYTQKSFWDIGEPSAPFSDHNFNPELFWRHETGGSNFVLQVGYEHESNGRDGPESRSWNRPYVRVTGIHRFGQKKSSQENQLIVSLKAWEALDVADENADITDYVGYGELYLGLRCPISNAQHRPLSAGVTLRKGTESGRGSIQLDASWPWFAFSDWVRKIETDDETVSVGPHIYVQYFRGEGEKLIAYKEQVSHFRVGVGVHF